MLTQLRPLNSTSIALDFNPGNGGIGIILAGNLIGCVDVDPVWGLSGTQLSTAKALGLSSSDTCYIYQNQVYISIEAATAQVIGAYLASTAVWDDLPDYM